MWAVSTVPARTDLLLRAAVPGTGPAGTRATGDPVALLEAAGVPGALLEAAANPGALVAATGDPEALLEGNGKTLWSIGR